MGNAPLTGNLGAVDRLLDSVRGGEPLQEEDYFWAHSVLEGAFITQDRLTRDNAALANAAVDTASSNGHLRTRITTRDAILKAMEAAFLAAGYAQPLLVDCLAALIRDKTALAARDPHVPEGHAQALCEERGNWLQEIRDALAAAGYTGTSPLACLKTALRDLEDEAGNCQHKDARLQEIRQLLIHAGYPHGGPINCLRRLLQDWAPKPGAPAAPQPGSHDDQTVAAQRARIKELEDVNAGLIRDIKQLVKDGEPNGRQLQHIHDALAAAGYPHGTARTRLKAALSDLEAREEEIATLSARVQKFVEAGPPHYKELQEIHDALCVIGRTGGTPLQRLTCLIQDFQSRSAALKQRDKERHTALARLGGAGYTAPGLVHGPLLDRIRDALRSLATRQDIIGKRDWEIQNLRAGLRPGEIKEAPQPKGTGAPVAAHPPTGGSNAAPPPGDPTATAPNVSPRTQDVQPPATPPAAPQEHEFGLRVPQILLDGLAALINRQLEIGNRQS